MKRILAALLATAAVLAVGAGVQDGTVVKTTAHSPIVIMTVGDSITADSNAYRTELTRLLNNANIPHTYIVAAWPGQPCSYIAGQLPALLATHNPDLVILSCGTNDGPGTTEAAYRAMLTQLASTNTVISWIGYADPRTALQAPWLLPNQKAANDAIYRARFGAPGHPAYPNVPIADFQAIPGTLEWLQPDGIHPNPRGYRAMAHIIYTKAAPLMGWPPAAEPKPCGLSGNWRDYPEPVPSVDYTECRQP